MQTNMQTVIGAFEDRATAQRAVDRLLAEGIGRDDVHIEQSDADTTGSPARETREYDEDYGSSIGGFFASIFGGAREHERHATRYAEAVRRGNSVVIVDASTPEQAERAAALLHELGAINVDERAEQWRASGWTEPEAARATEGDQTLNVVQEELQVGKRMVERGGVRVFERVSEKPVRELLRLREERAVVERRPVDREASPEELANFREGSIEVRERAEEPVVAKTTHNDEEERESKDEQEREQSVEDTVRRKDVEVQRMEGDRAIERERAVAKDGEVAPDRTRTNKGKPRKNV